MAKKEYPAWHYFVAAALAFLFALNFATLDAGMLYAPFAPIFAGIAIWLGVKGVKARKAKAAPMVA